MRTVDIDSITTILCEQPEETMTNAEMAEWLEEQDVEEIVNCAECEHCNLHAGRINQTCLLSGMKVWKDDFCSKGVRRNEYIV